VADNCNHIVVVASVVLLLMRLLRAQLRAVKESHPDELPVEYVAGCALIFAQLGGLAAWLLRHLVERIRVSKLASLLGAPIAVWSIWRVLFRHMRQLHDRQDSAEFQGVGGESRRALQAVVWQVALIVEQSLVAGYIVGILPPAFAGEVRALSLHLSPSLSHLLLAVFIFRLGSLCGLCRLGCLFHGGHSHLVDASRASGPSPPPLVSAGRLAACRVRV
jgi:hypothetical protein